ncbi:MAG: MauE/DoxX family redox-associated membrane protein [Acidobacteriota bacterium]
MDSITLTLIATSLYLGLSCLLKTLAPWHLAGVVRGLLPVGPRLGATLAALVIGWEAALAVSLVVVPALAVTPAIGTFAVFVVLLGHGWWRGATDCGCHGPGVAMHPLVSLVLDLGLLVCLLLIRAQVPAWPLAWGLASLVVFLLVVVFCWLQADALARGRGPWLDLSAARPGQLLPSGLVDDTAGSGRTQLVALLAPDCPLCQAWLKVLATVHRREDLPTVLALQAQSQTSEDQPDSPVPMRAISRWRFGRLALTTPSALVVVDGRVTERWLRTMPESFVNQLR